MATEVEKTFVITIKKEGDTHHIIAHSDKVTVEPLPFPSTQDLLSEEQRKLLQSLSSETANASSAELQAIGQTLYKAIFLPPIAVAYGQSQSAGKNDVATRLCLQVEPPELATLPWEALHDGHDWLALNPTAPLVRRLIQSEEVKVLNKLQVKGAVKVLFVGASPEDQPKLEIEAALQSLQERLQEPIKKKQIQLDSLLNPTLDQLREQLLKDYHILYFSGHGSPQGIFVSDGYDGSQVVSTETLAQALEGKATRLVYLAACNTSTQTDPKDRLLLEGFAQELAERANLPAIVAMQYYLSNMNANTMSGHFFAALAQFRPVDVALAEARTAAVMGDAVGRDALAPVIYLQADDATLFQKARNWPLIAALIAFVMALIFASYLGVSRKIEGDVAATRIANEQAISVAKSTAVAIEQAQKERAAALARSRELAKKSSDELQNGNYEIAILLAIESGRVADTVEAFAAIRTAIANPWHSRTILQGHTGSIYQATWNRDESKILTNSEDKTARIWDAQVSAGHGQELVKLTGHTGSVYQATWSQDGSKVLTCSEDKTARIWDAATGQELVKLTGHTESVYQATWSQDESRILTISADNTVGIWDARVPAGRGQELIKLVGHTDRIAQAIWSQNESKILTASFDNTARIWDATTGKELFKLSGHTGGIWHTMWNHDESKILTTSDDSTVRIWDATSGTELVKLEGVDGVWPAIWSQDESKILASRDDNNVGVWDATTAKELVKLTGHLGRVTQVLWNKDESKILTASWDHTARIWDATTGTELVKLVGHTNNVLHATWSQDESKILTTGCDEGNIANCFQSSIRIWDATTGKELFKLKGHTNQILLVTWSRDQSKLLTASADHTARIWDIIRGAELVRLEGHTAPVLAATWNRDESKILTNSDDYTARIWDAFTGQELVKLLGHTEWVWQAIWSQDESKILTDSGDNTARIWNASTGKELVRFDGHTDSIWQVRWNRNESKIITGSSDGTVRVWDAATGQELVKLAGHTSGINMATWNQDESKILTCSLDNTARIWDAATGKELVKLAGHTDNLLQATWSRDESKILTASWDKTVRIWDAATGRELVKLLGHTDRVWAATWSKDESKILTNAQDNSVRIWDATTGKELIKLLGHTDYVSQATWNRDESKILTISNDHTTRIWDATTGKELVRLIGHTAGVWQAKWSRDESKILTTGCDEGVGMYCPRSSARVWDAASGAELARLEGYSGNVSQATWSQDESKILISSADHTASVWYVHMTDLINAACHWVPRNMTAIEWNQYMQNVYQPTCPTVVLS